MTSLNANLYAHFQRIFHIHASKPAIFTVDGKTLTYTELDLVSARLANYLAGLGVVPGDRVSVQVEKSPQALCLYLACLRAGLVFHPLNTGYKESELSYFLENASPAVLICDARDETLLSRLAIEAGIAHLLTLNGDGSGTLMEGAERVAADFGVIQRAGDDLAALLYSSGTTGVPKGIMLSHKNLLSNATSLVEAWGFSENDILLHALPIFHVHGLFVAVGCVLLSGASMRWLAAFHLDEVLSQLPHSTVMMGVPTYYTRLLADRRFDREVARGMRLFVSGSAPLLAETFTEFQRRTGHSILERYGMTETGMNTSNPLRGERKAGTVGPPLPGVELRVVDDDNKPLPRGHIGNLQVRGDNVFNGYWQLPEKTREDFTADGFFNTGDKGLVDEDGYVAIVGRAKDMVITGGLNVYPKEVELVIDEMPSVRESAVIGVAHADFGEAVVAVVVPSTAEPVDEAAIIAALKEQLSSYKVPKRVISVEALPRNTMGKVQKSLLRDRFSALFK